jgi:hypothetical protein
VLLALPVIGAEDDFYGTYRLISSTRTIVETGEVLDTFGKHPTGFTNYGKDGRFMELIVYDNRPKPESIAKMTDQQRADLHRTMISSAGTYTFDGKTVQKHVEASWNEVWTGSTQIRDVRREGDNLVFTTRAAPSASDGKVSITTLVWEKVK